MAAFAGATYLQLAFCPIGPPVTDKGYLMHRLLALLFMVIMFDGALTNSAKAEYWYTTDIPTKQIITGGDCFSLAFTQLCNWGSGCAGYQLEPSWVSDNMCKVDAWNNAGGWHIFRGSGYGQLACDDEPGKTKYKGKCVDTEEFSKARVAESACINPRFGNPIVPLSQSKQQHAVDFTTGGADPLTFERFYGRFGRGLWRFGDTSRFGVGWRSNVITHALVRGKNP
jgi:hypothetical protein